MILKKMDFNKLTARGFWAILLVLILAGFLTAGISGYVIDFIIYLIKNLMF